MRVPQGNASEAGPLVVSPYPVKPSFPSHFFPEKQSLHFLVVTVLPRMSWFSGIHDEY